MGSDAQFSPLNKPCPQDESKIMMDDSQLIGAPPDISAAVGGVGFADVQMMTELKPGKRRRGRPPKGQDKLLPKENDDEEDVCFICFDGGSLVLCDRRGCPKAYHPACIKRDEAFFRSKAKWNCGWHICSSCQKASHFMCYTCTYSLCKGCAEDADYLCVRGNKGFCGTCMRTIMLIENNVPGDKGMVQVDFDDKSSWEYLFKVYWIYLKQKLTLTLDELSWAKNPWKGTSILVHKEESTNELYDANGNNGSCSENSSRDLEGNSSKRRKTQNPSLEKEDPLTILEAGGIRGTHLSEVTEWASKELLEFVAHMKSGDTSVISQYDVQALLQEYINRNSLSDPSQECQILCDSKLLKLFGKEHVGHVEMLKLLDSHYLVKENSPVDDGNRQGRFDAVPGQVELDGKNNNQMMMATNDTKHETCKKPDVVAPKNNAVEFAAIDTHNINLIYLTRNLMEKLIGDADKFHDKVVGSVVRISISSTNPNQDLHRLVQVVGTQTVTEPYKIGTRTADVMLEILNLDKKEVISIDDISNQNFSEDECRSLHQSMKSGFIKRWTVGDIQEKATALQAMRVNDWLEAQILQLSQLRDRANEKGQRKDLRACGEKFQRLNPPGAHEHRLLPEVYNSLTMHPAYESKDVGELREKKQDGHPRPRNSGKRKGRKPISPRRGAFNNIGSRPNKNLAASSEGGRNKCTKFHVDKESATLALTKENKSSLNQGREAFEINSLNIPKTQIDSNGLVAGWNNQAAVRSESLSGVTSEISLPAFSTGMEQSAYNKETDKLWHYRDPTGRVQGPFPMVQLWKWSASGYFPSDLRIWKLNEKQDDSVLLSDALNGLYYKELPVLSNSCLPFERATVSSHGRYDDLSSVRSRGISPIQTDTQGDEGSWNLKQSDKAALSIGKAEFEKSNGQRSNSSSETKPADALNSSEGQSGNIVQGWDSLKDNNICTVQPQVSSSLLSPVFSKPCETVSNRVAEEHSDGKHNACEKDVRQNSHMNAMEETDGGHSYEKRSESDTGQSSGQNWRTPHISNSSTGWDSNTHFVSRAVSHGASNQKQEIDFFNFPSPTTKPSNVDSKYQDTESKQSLSSSVPVQISGPTWSTASSLVGSGAQLSEVAHDWGRYSRTPDNPSVEEWDSNIVSASSLKPTVARDRAATPTSGFGELRHSSHPTTNPSNWQAIVTEANEFSPLADESVSDLLAEVEAMESLVGLSSPTSIMNCGVELTLGKHNCFDSAGRFSPAPDLGGDAMSSTSDLLITSQSTATDETQGVLKADADPRKRSGRHSSPVELDGHTRHRDVSVNRWEAGSNVQPSAPSTTQYMAATDTTRRGGSEITDANWGPVQGQTILGWGGLDLGHTNIGGGTDRATTQGNAGVNRETLAGNQAVRGSQPSGERLYGPREEGFLRGLRKW